MTVSIIIPAYNVDQYIERAIKSCIDQTYKDIQIIIINDGSTDLTQNVINQFTDSRILKLEQENKGVSAARNYGLDQSLGELCIFLDGDDWLEKDAIQSLISVYKKEKCFIFSTYKDAFIEEDDIRTDETLAMIGPEGRIQWMGYQQSYRPYLAINSSCYKLFDMRIIRNNSIRFDETISNGEDGLFNCLYLQHIKSIYYIPKQLWVILDRQGSASRDTFKSSQLSILRAIDQMSEVSTVDDTSYFKKYKCERVYYYAWQLIRSNCRNQKIIDQIRELLNKGARTFIFGKTKCRSKLKYIYMLCWYVHHAKNKSCESID